MRKQYTSYIRNISPRPRSKRLRELGGGVVSVASGGAAASGDGHSHANKELLDSLAFDDDGNLSTTGIDSEGDTIYTPYLKKAVFDDLFEKVVISEGRYAIRTKYDLYSDGDITALGRLALSAPGGSGTGVAGMYYGDWTDYSEDYDSYAVSGKSGKALYDLIKNAGGGGVDASQLGSLTISRNGVTAGVYSPSKASVIDITVPTRLSELIDDKGYLGRADADSLYLKASDLIRSYPYTQGTIANVRGDGVMEVGKYIDFHDGSGDTSDYNPRLMAQNGALYINSSRILTEGNYASSLDSRYVKKSGDMMSGRLTITGGSGTGSGLVTDEINTNNLNGLLTYHPASWTGVTNQQWSVGTVDSQGVIRSNNTSLLHYRNSAGTLSTIWDSGNDGSGSGLDADLLDGLHGGDFARSYNNMWTNGETVAEWAKRVVTTPGINSMVGWAWASSVNLTLGSYTIDCERYSAIDFRQGNLNNTWNQKAILFLPTYRDSSMIYIAQMYTGENAGVVATTVKRYADYDTVLASNVASATKLQTARTLWGQSFDGTADVSGDLILYGENTFNASSSKLYFRSRLTGNNGPYIQGISSGGYDKQRIAIFQSNTSSYNHEYFEALTIMPSGYVGINTPTPAYPFDVNGSARVTSLLISSGLVEWDASRNAFKFNGNLYATGDITALGSSAVGGSGSGGGVDTLAQLADVTLSGLSAGHALVYDGTKWVNRSIAAAGLDLSGLAQYLSTNQYLTQPAADARYVTLATEQTITGKKTFTSECTTVTRQMRVDGASSSFAALPHLMLHIPNVNWAKFVLKNDGTVHLLNGGATDFNSYGHLTASAFVKYGGTSSQYLMADGSVRGETYFRQNCGNIPVEYVDITNYNVNAPGYANYQSGTYMVSRSGHSEILVNLALNAGSTSALQFRTSYSDSAPLYFRKTVDSNRVSGPWREILTSVNYTSFVNPANFVTALGTSGNYLTWTKNGVTNNITVPYATNADTVDGLHAMGRDSSSGLTRSWARGTYTNLDEYYGNGNVVVFDPAPTSATSAGQNISHSANTILLSLGESSLRYTQLVFYYDTDTIRYRRKANSDWQNWVTLLHTGNYSSVLDGRYVKKSGDTMSGILYAPRINVGNMYWEAGSGIMPTIAGNNTLTCGKADGRWANVYATTINVTSTSLVTNLNADLLDGYHANGLFTELARTGSHNNTISATIGGTTRSVGLYPISSWGIRYMYKSDNSGRPTIFLIADITSWKGSASNAPHYGFTGRVTETRAGGYIGEKLTDVICRCGYSDSPYTNTTHLRTSNDGNVSPKVIQHNGKYYLGLLFNGSGHDVVMEGFFYNCLSTFIELMYDANNALPSGASDVTASYESYTYADASVTSATKWRTARRFWGQLADGTADVNGAMTVNYAGTETGISIYRQEGAGAFIRYYNNNQTSNYFRAGMYGAGYFGISYNSGADAFAVTASGYVGINTPTPAYPFDVNGSARVRGDMTVSGKIEMNGALINRSGAIELYAPTPYIDFHYGSTTTDYTSRIIESASGRLSITGKLSLGYVNDSYRLAVDSLICSSWLRTTGTAGWYSETYGGGWYMSDTTWLRIHGNKNLYASSGIIRTDGEFQIGDSGNKFRVDAQGNAWVKSIYVGGILLSHDTVNGGLKITGNAYTTGDLTALGVMGGAQSITMLGVNTTNPAYNLDVNGTGRFTGVLNLSSGATHMGARVGNTYINSIDGNLIFQNVDQIRFGGDAWNYAQWAGLKYNHSAKTIYLGIADGNTFATAGTAQTGGKLSLVNCDLVVPQGYKIQLGPITIIYNATTNSIDIQGNVRYTGTLSKA